MEQKLLETAFKTFLDEFIKSSKQLFSEGEKEILHLFKIGLKKYLGRYKNKFISIKTILQGSSPVYLYDFYFPLGVIESKRIPKYHKNYYDHAFNIQSISTNSAKNLFNEGNYLTIMGDAGSGKSTLVKHLFLNCIKEKYGIPFLLELRYLNDFPNSIEEYIVSKIFENEIGSSVSIIQRMLNQGNFVFFLDGYDEINSDRKEKIVSNIEEFITKFPENKYILTSRPYSNIEHFQKFKNYTISRLNEVEIEAFVKKQLPREKELADKIILSIKENSNNYIKTFLTNPLLLSLYILTYQSNSEIPPKKYIFYRRVIQALFSEHDSKTKIGYRRERQTELIQEQFEEVLKKFSFLSFFDSKYDFEYDYIVDTLKIIKEKPPEIKFDNNKFINDLKSALALWVEDNGIYSFAHRSMQEYYVANFIKRLDDTNKKVIYQKIIGRTTHGLNSETHNLLNLCEEMDPYYFYLFYKLPLLQEFQLKLNFDTNESLIKSVICHLYQSFNVDFNIKEENYNSFEINFDIYRYIYFHLEHMQKINSMMYGYPRYLSNNNKSKSKRFNQQLSSENFPTTLMDYCVKNKVQTLIQDMVNWLDSELKRTSEFIADTSRSNNELVSMI